MKSLHKQRGAVMILVVVGMVALLAMAGLALDGSHAMLNKTRLQNAVDAAALGGAKELDLTADIFAARNEVEAIFGANGAAPGNGEMGRAYADGTINLEVQFSSTLNPFVSGTSPPEYVRVRARNFRLPIWFAAIVGATEKVVAATAVAGPSPTINTACNIAPMMVCGAPEKTEEEPNGGPPYWGYTPGEPTVLKSSDSGTPGVGNFQLIRLGDNTGANDVRDALAGNYDGCASTGDVIVTEPGNTVGPVRMGLNTRFGEYLGSMQGLESVYPPDVITEEPSPAITITTFKDGRPDEMWQGDTLIQGEQDLSYTRADYLSALGQHNYNNPDGTFLRREVAIPVGDCSVPVNGQSEVPLLGFGCYFLLQKVSQGGQDSNIFGQFIRDCNAGGIPGPDPGDGPGIYIIQLYKDPDSPDA